MPASILIVDDDPRVQQVLSDLLVSRGHSVVSADSSPRAIEELGRQRFEVVLVEVGLSGGEGASLVAQLKERDPLQEVVVITSTTDVQASIAALRAGVSDYLLKPAGEAEVLSTVDTCLERIAVRRERSRIDTEHLAVSRFQSITRHCLELLSLPDLEWLQERILSDFTALCDAQSAALWVIDDREELRLKAYRGLLDRQSLSDRLSLAGALGPRLQDGTPWLSGMVPSMTLFVPLLASGEVMGLVQLSDPLAGEFRGELVQTAQMLSDFAALGVKNGRRFMALQRLGLRDRDTAAYNLSYFTDYASKEIYKARRYGRTFSLITFSMDNLSQLRSRLGIQDAKRATRGVIRALSRIIRDPDVLAKASEQEFYLLLPETDFFGAVMFLRRAAAAIRVEPDAREIDERLPLGVVGGAATYPKDGEDFDELVNCCRRRLDGRRSSLQRKLALDPMPFWDKVDLLVGNTQSPRLPSDDDSEPSRRGKVAPLLFEELQSEIARELNRDPHSRGLLYVGGSEIRSDMPLLRGLDRVPPDFSPRVYLLGRRADMEFHPAATPVFLEGDERIHRHQFIFWLSENAAYALIQRKGHGATWGFHSSDNTVVEGLISKLQSEYDLQPY